MALTALERDLLAYVERLVTACETLTAELSGLEKRSTGEMQNQVDGLAAFIALLTRSQTASMTALENLLNEASNYEEATEQLQTSLKLVKAAERQLNER